MIKQLQPLTCSNVKLSHTEKSRHTGISRHRVIPPKAANVSLRSFLSMKPSLFWSMMVKACGGFIACCFSGMHSEHSPQSKGLKLNVKGNMWQSTDFFELLDLGLFKHGEHVGAGSLRSLLCFLGCLRNLTKSPESDGTLMTPPSPGSFSHPTCGVFACCFRWINWRRV